MTTTEITPADLQQLSERVRKLYVRCAELRLRLRFLSISPTGDLMADILGEISRLRSQAAEIWSCREMFDLYSRAAAVAKWEDLPAETTSFHFAALQIACRFLEALRWHGQRLVTMPEAMSWRPPDELVAIDAEITGQIAKEFAEDFEGDVIEPMLPREAAAAAAELAKDRAAGEGNAELQTLRLVVDDDEYMSVKAVLESDESVDSKLRTLYRLDRKYRDMEGGTLAALLNVTPAAIRKTDAWKIDRKEYRAAEARKSVHTGEP